MLKPVEPIVEPVHGSDSPTVICEAADCNKSGPSHTMINFLVGIGSPGRASLNGFQCPGSGQIAGSPEHWACSPECWLKVAHACIDEHMHPLLLQVRQ